MDSLRYIDTTISLPIHKFISPLFVLIIGIVLFNESLNIYEWLGIIAGMFVPLLLINKSENLRQTNLQKGIILITISGLLSALAFAMNKEGTELFSSVILYVAIVQGFMAIIGAILYKNRRPNKLHADIHIYDPKLLKLVLFGGVIQFISFVSAMLALTFGGALAIVYTIQSLYIIIPIILSVIFFSEHWNAKKVFVIGLSISAIVLMQ
jgi:drug/metabolite transporter (DMT)-like permease